MPDFDIIHLEFSQLHALILTNQTFLGFEISTILGFGIPIISHFRERISIYILSSILEVSITFRGLPLILVMIAPNDYLLTFLSYKPLLYFLIGLFKEMET